MRAVTDQGMGTAWKVSSEGLPYMLLFFVCLVWQDACLPHALLPC